MEKRFLLFLLILSFPLIAQTNHWRSYLPNKSMYDCLTAGNYLYAINYNGLIKYDLTTGSYINYTKNNCPVKFKTDSKLAKDNNNNIWFYTQNSLVEFDGTGFTKFNFTEESLRGNDIAVDNDNNVWIATEWGLVKFSGGTFEILKPDTLGYTFEYGFNTVAVSPEGDVWTSTNLFIARYSGNQWRVFTDEVRDVFVLCLYVDRDNTVWAGGLHGFYTYDGSDWIYNNGSRLAQDEVQTITEDTYGNMWFGTRRGLTKFDGSHWFSYLLHNSSLPHLWIDALCAGDDGSVYIATRNGVAKYSGESWENYSFSQYNFSYDAVHNAVIDRYGKIWISSGDHRGGINIEYPDVLQSLENTELDTLYLDSWIYRINDIMVDRANNKWISTNNGLFEINDEGYKVFDHRNSPLPASYINSADQDAAGNIWACVAGGGLAMFNGTRWTIYDTTNSGIPDNFVHKVIVDNAQNLWVGTNSGLGVFNGRTWTVYNTENSGLKQNFIYDFAVDRKGDVWLSTNLGLQHFNGITWEIFDPNNSPLPTNFINDIAVDKVNNLWVAIFEGGLLKKSADGWIIYNEDNSPLLNNNINSLYTDRNNNIIIGTNTGLNIFNEGGVNFFYEPDPEKLPEYFGITQNYPNPFNISTKMVYKVGVESWVSIKVYNILGKEVRTLVNEMKVPGYYSVDFNGEGLASGVYIYRMQAGRFVQTLKAILLK